MSEGPIKIAQTGIIRIEVYPSRTTPLKKGKITANGEEQTVLEYTGTGIISGHIDLKNMDDGDTVIIRQYIKAAEEEDYTKYAEEQYKDKQENPLIYITPKAIDIAIKVTIQQTTGTYKTFNYNFVREP
jgi:hypothetical protein